MAQAAAAIRETQRQAQLRGMKQFFPYGGVEVQANEAARQGSGSARVDMPFQDKTGQKNAVADRQRI